MTVCVVISGSLTLNLFNHTQFAIPLRLPNGEFTCTPHRYCKGACSDLIEFMPSNCRFKKLEKQRFNTCIRVLSGGILCLTAKEIFNRTRISIVLQIQLLLVETSLQTHNTFQSNLKLKAQFFLHKIWLATFAYYCDGKFPITVWQIFSYPHDSCMKNGAKSHKNKGNVSKDINPCGHIPRWSIDDS